MATTKSQKQLEEERRRAIQTAAQQIVERNKARLQTLSTTQQQGQTTGDDESELRRVIQNVNPQRNPIANLTEAERERARTILALRPQNSAMRPPTAQETHNRYGLDKVALAQNRAARKRQQRSDAVATSNNNVLISPTAQQQPYYSRPNFWAGTDKLQQQQSRAAERLEREAPDYVKAVQSLNASKQQLDKLLQTYRQAPTTENQAAYEQARKQYVQDSTMINRMGQQYQPLISDLVQAERQLSSYQANQSAAYDRWKSTVRDEDSVSADREKVKAEINRLEDEKRWLESDRDRYVEDVAGVGIEEYRRRQQPIAEVDQRISEAEEPLAKLEQQLADLYAKRDLLREEEGWAKQFHYEDMRQNPDFAALSQPDESLADRGEDWKKYQYINNLGGVRDRVTVTREGEGGKNKKYAYMTDGEKATYNYLYAKEGPEAAKEYLDYLEEGLNYQWAQDYVKRYDEPGGQVQKYADAVTFGAESFFTNWTKNFDGDRPTPWGEFVTQEGRESTEGAGRFLYDALYTAGNMAPSILLSLAAGGIAGAAGASAGTASTVGQVAGNVALSGSAAGNAYNEKIEAGYEPEEARAYSLLIGASEGLLQSALGGISRLGGTSGKLASRIGSINNAFLRVATKTGVSMLGEGAEEALQEILDPIFAVIALDEAYTPAELEDVAYSFLLGALMGGVFEGGEIAGDEINLRQSGKSLQAMGPEVVQKLIDTGLGSEQGSTAYQVAQKLQALTETGQEINPYQLGLLYKESIEGGAYGKNGKAARRAILSENQGQGAELDFETYYWMGRNGKTFEEAQEVANNSLPEPKRQQAFWAGQNDRALPQENENAILEAQGGIPNAERAESGSQPLPHAGGVAAYPGMGDNSEGGIPGWKPISGGRGTASGLLENGGRKQGMVAGEWPDGRGSEPSPVQNRGVSRLSAEQQARLAETAIRDEAGEPLEVVHWTPNLEFTEFGEGDIGFHFGSEAQGTKRARDLKQDPQNGRYIRAYLDIKNPVSVQGDQMGWSVAQAAHTLGRQGFISFEDHLRIRDMAFDDGGRYNSESAKALRQLLADKGYDGISYDNEVEGEGKSYIAFSPEQVLIVDDGKGNQQAAGGEPAVSTTQAKVKQGGVVKNEWRYKTNARVVRIVEALAKYLGVEVEFTAPKSIRTQSGQIADGEYDSASGRIRIDSRAQDPILEVLKHEITHRMRSLAPAEYQAYAKFVLTAALDGEYAPQATAKINRILEVYRETGDFTMDKAVEEFVADFSVNLLQKDRVIRKLWRENMSLGQKILEWIKDIRAALRSAKESVKPKFRRDYGLAEEQIKKAEQLYTEGLRAAHLEAERRLAQQKPAQGKAGGKKHKIRDSFASKLDAWFQEMDQEERLIDHGYFTVGTVSEPLKGIGVRDGKVYWRKSKIAQIMEDHPEMDEATIKRVPEILENPVIVMKSQTREDSIVLFGDLNAPDGQRVLAALDLTPKAGGGLEAEFSLITSAYGKKESGAKNLIENSELLYLDPQKDRTDTWLMQLRVQFPSGQPAYGSIGTISYAGGKVNIQGPVFSEYFGLEATTAQESQDGKKYKISYDANNTPFVAVEEDILSGVPKGQWINAVKTVLAERFPDGVHVGNNVVKINSQTRREMTFSEYTKWLGRNDKSRYADKFRMAGYVDEIILASRGYINEGLKHARKDNIRDFARGTVLLHVGSKDYTAEVVVGTTAGGDMLLYDIVNMQETTISKKTDAPYSPTQGEGRRSGASVSAPTLSQDEVQVNSQSMQNGEEYTPEGRYSLPEIRRWEREAMRLREEVDYLKGELKRTRGREADPKLIKTLAGELLAAYRSEYDQKALTQELKELYRLGRSGQDPQSKAEEIAGRILEAGETLQDELEQDYRELRESLQGRQDSLTAEQRSELAELWPEWFSDEGEAARAGQVLDELERVYDNPYGGDYATAKGWVAADIYQRLFQIPPRESYADQQARKLAEAKLATRMHEGRATAQAKRLLEAERVRRQRAVTELQEKQRAGKQAQSRKQQERELRAKIQRATRRLSPKLLRPTNEQHIPEELRGPVALLLDSINLESSYSISPLTGRKLPYEGGRPTKKTEAFRELRKAYQKIIDGETDMPMTVDPDLVSNLDKLADMGEQPIASMNKEQLELIWQTVKAVEASIRTANKALAMEQFGTIHGIAEGIREDNQGLKQKGAMGKAKAKLDGFFNEDMLNPLTFFHRLGPTGLKIYQALRDAQDKQINLLHASQEATRKMIEEFGGEKAVQELDKQVHEIKLKDGGTLTMTVPQIMGLYELMKRDQAILHILKGGIRPTDIIQKGHKRTYPDKVKVTDADCEALFAKLTDKQIELADKLQDYMANGDPVQAGNEASMRVYGYRKFMEDAYYRIVTDPNYGKGNKDEGNNKHAPAPTIANKGMAKQTVEGAKNPIIIGSIFDVYLQHINDMTTYGAWLEVMEDLRRIENFNFYEPVQDGDKVTRELTGSIRSLLEGRFGEGAKRYWDKITDNINRGVQVERDSGFFNFLTTNFKAAAVGANLRVVIQQPTAIVRAATEINPDYLFHGLFTMPDSLTNKGRWEMIMEYAPIARWKNWGYFDLNTGRQIKDVMLGTASKLEKVRQLGMSLAGWADKITWTTIWNAAEYEIRAKKPDLTVGSDRFYTEVGKRFSQIIDRTQVVDGILQRSQLMRSSSDGVKMATSFMAEPTQSYNIFARAIYDLGNAKTALEKEAAKKKLARSVISLATTMIVTAAAQSVIDAGRDDDKEKNYLERYWTALSGLEGDEEGAWETAWAIFRGNLGENLDPMGSIPYFKDVLSIWEGYDVERMDMTIISDLADSGKNLYKSIAGEGKYSIVNASFIFLADAGRLLGLPVANLRRLIEKTANTFWATHKNYMGQYRLNKALYDIGFKSNKGLFYDNLYRAYKDKEARDVYMAIRRDMENHGFDKDEITKALRLREKQEQEYLDTVDSLTEPMSKKIEDSRAYQKLDEERQNAVQKSMESYSKALAYWQVYKKEPLSGWMVDARNARKDLGLSVEQYMILRQSYGRKNSAGTWKSILDDNKRYEKVVTAKQLMDIAPEVYLQFCLNLPKYDEDENDKYSNAEIEDAVKAIPGLTKEQRAMLWQMQTGAPNNANNPFSMSGGRKYLKEVEEGSK